MIVHDVVRKISNLLSHNESKRPSSFPVDFIRFPFCDEWIIKASLTLFPRCYLTKLKHDYQLPEQAFVSVQLHLHCFVYTALSPMKNKKCITEPEID